MRCVGVDKNTSGMYKLVCDPGEQHSTVCVDALADRSDRTVCSLVKLLVVPLSRVTASGVPPSRTRSLLLHRAFATLRPALS